jgi:hypothetical protein
METNSNTREFSPEDSLKVITDMIATTRNKIGKNYFYYLFWGYLVAATSILEYVLITVSAYVKHYLVWPVFMLAGSLITIAFYLKEERSRTSKTFVGNAMIYLWAGWFISFGLLLLFVNLRQEYGLILPMVMAMYGLAIFVAGGIVSFKPLIMGAVIAWIASAGSYFADYPIQLLILAGMVIISHVIPGHILRNSSKA